MSWSYSTSASGDGLRGRKRLARLIKKAKDALEAQMDVLRTDRDAATQALDAKIAELLRATGAGA